MTTPQTPQLQAAARERTGTRYAARIRKEGRLPAIIYGHKKDPVCVSVDAKEINDIIRLHTHLIEVVRNGDTQACLIKDVQWDHLGSTIIHVDLTRVDLSETVTVDVELTFVGEAIGLKEENTILEHPNTSVEIECRVTDIPDALQVDVSHLNPGDTLTVSDLQLSPGLTCTTSNETVLAAVRVVEEMIEEELEPTEDAGEPQVLGREGAETDAGDETDTNDN